jgi:hypothetical protein
MENSLLVPYKYKHKNSLDSAIKNEIKRNLEIYNYCNQNKIKKNIKTNNKVIM